MKTKNITRKLSLNKKTIADLKGSYMAHLKAGLNKPLDPCRDTWAISGCVSGITCNTICTCPSACSLGGNCC